MSFPFHLYLQIKSSKAMVPWKVLALHKVVIDVVIVMIRGLDNLVFLFIHETLRIPFNLSISCRMNPMGRQKSKETKIARGELHSSVRIVNCRNFYQCIIGRSSITQQNWKICWSPWHTWRLPGIISWAICRSPELAEGPEHLQIQSHCRRVHCVQPTLPGSQ